MKKKLTRHDVGIKVEQSLAHHHRPGWRIEVVKKGIHQEDDWWYVPVRPDQDTRRTIHYYDLLAEVESELQDDENLNILLVPVSSDD
jgi:hypothetical protein